MHTANKHVIWTNRLDLEEHRNSMPPEEIAGLTDAELTSRMCEENELWLSDEKENLSKIQYNEPLLIISDLGLWRGRFPGYKDVDSGKLTDCFACTRGEIVEWYVDMYGNLRCDDTHHDGTNHYLVRVWKNGHLGPSPRKAPRCYPVRTCNAYSLRSLHKRCGERHCQHLWMESARNEVTRRQHHGNRKISRLLWVPCIH